ncbi:integrase, catalytic region, zinc finger, CCHC-type containing protein [Tanacetum coccineum]
MTTLADKSLLSGGDNKPPMLEKHLYDSWKSIMELYMMNRPHGRMILASVEKGPLVWPTITVDGVTRPKEYTELTPAETIQVDCDIKTINIILQGIPTEIYAFVSQHRVAKDIWEKIKLLMQGTSLTKQRPRVYEYLQDVTEQFKSISKFLNTITSRYPTTNNQPRNSSNPRQQATINDGRVTVQPVQGRQISYAAGTTRTFTPGASGSNSGKQRIVTCYNCKGEGHMSKQCTKPRRKRDDSWFKDKVLLVQAQASGQILHEEELAFLADLRIPEAQAIQTAVVQKNSNSSAQQDALILSVIEQLKTQVANCFQNPFYLKNAQQLEPKLYVGDIIEKTNPIVIPDSEETLLLAEESRSKMLLRQKDPIILWSKNSVNSPEPILSSRPTMVEVPKELPKVSMSKCLSSNGTGLEQYRLESKTFEVKMNQVLNENERLLEQVINKDIVNVILNSSADIASVNVHECEKCLKLETELQTDFIEKEIYDKLFKSFTTLEKHCISLEVDSQLNQEIFQRDNPVSNQSAPSFDQLFELNELKA